MSDRPILFSSPMVRALLAGAKTQTRRVCKLGVRYNGGMPAKGSDCIPCLCDYLPPGALMIEDPKYHEHQGFCEGGESFCPYGKPGDRLWVRETWCKLWPEHQMSDPDAGRYYYAATDRAPVLCDGDGFTDYTKDGRERSPWKSPIHMPRAASRITLEITGVRVERLQEISEADAKAEGITPLPGDGPNRYTVDVGGSHLSQTTARETYRMLWEWINGADSWAANPWVWAIEFKKTAP